MDGSERRGSTAPQAQQREKQPVRLSRWRRLLRFVLRAGLLAGLLLALAVAYEMHSSRLQAHYLSRYAASLDYRLATGPSPRILFPREGPFDQRLGYTHLPLFMQRALQRDFSLQQQAVFSPALRDYVERGYFPPYEEKIQAGLRLHDCALRPLYRFDYPQQVYADYSAIPPLVVQTLSFIEDRQLLRQAQPHSNPAVDWPRLFQAAFSQAQRWLSLDARSAGGSTLATQMEKFRHSPDGRTGSMAEKWRQMSSASLRAYRHGEDTRGVRADLIRDYLNAVPLSAVPGHGEVHGLADGLRVWFGADFDDVNRALSEPLEQHVEAASRGLALRQVLALLIAQRRPSYYLAQGRLELAALADSYLRLLHREGLIDAELRDAALEAPLEFRDWSLSPIANPNTGGKDVALVRQQLGRLLNLPLYSLDRLDLEVQTSLDAALQTALTDYLRGLRDPSRAEAAGLLGDKLLQPERLDSVRYSFTLFEREADRFAVRVQTDSTLQPFDLNQNSKLELGSTAKLRVVTTYLEIIAELHQRYAGLGAAQLRSIDTDPSDRLTRWVLAQLLEQPQIELPALLEAALERRYSASPNERFVTGGGVHRFSNYQRKEDHRVPTVREALRESINLPFVRLMRDIVSYSIYQSVPDRGALLRDDADPRRENYLRRFADREGQTYLRRFWGKFAGKSEAERIDALLEGLAPRPVRLAAVHRYLFPEASRSEFADFLQQRTPESVAAAEVDRLYQRYRHDAYELPDRAYIARVHPLELWLLAYLTAQPGAALEDALEASTLVRQQSYDWLFRSRHKIARDRRIRIMLEVEAFLDIHQRWQRQGYPFGHLVPSLATALGSSGDRPTALAELVGILLNDGVRLPTVRIQQLGFARDTPYQTELQRRVDGGERVMPAAVAAALRGLLADVVANGTGRRLRGSYQAADGGPLAVGGKTGTGDNRIDSVNAAGQVIESRAMNRTATFAFYLGDRHFGALTAFVPGAGADDFSFTSALPVQILKDMQPLLAPYLANGCSEAVLSQAAVTPPRVEPTRRSAAAAR